MSNRTSLQTLLETELGSTVSVYFKRPKTIQMSYPAIVGERNDIDKRYANNIAYHIRDSWTLTFISKNIDDPLIDKIIKLPYCSYDRHYMADNLSHDVFTIYY